MLFLLAFLITSNVLVNPILLITAYVQEMGHAGRDGHPAKAILYYNANDLGQSGQTELQKEMKDFCITAMCRREVIANYFDFILEKLVPSHLCCDNCEKKIQCHDCLDSQMIACAVLEEVQVDVDEVDVENIEELRNGELQVMLSENFVAENIYRGDINTGYNDELVNELMKVSVNDYDELRLQFPFLTRTMALDIMAIMSHHK